MDNSLWNIIWDGQTFGYYLSQLLSILACAIYFGNMKLRSIFLRKIVKAFEIDRAGFDERICENHLSTSDSSLSVHFSCPARYGPHNSCTVHSFRGPESYFELSITQSIVEQIEMTKLNPKTIPNSYLVKVFYFASLIFTISQFYCTFRNRNENDEMCFFETPFKDFSEVIHTFDLSNIDVFTTEGKHPSFQCLVFKNEIQRKKIE